MVKDPQKVAAGHMGGLRTLQRHGRDHFVRIGRKGGPLGGRPRQDIIPEIRQEQARIQRRELFI